MTNILIDVHCHLADDRYQDIDPGEVIKRAREGGTGMILNGTGMAENLAHIRMAEENDGVWVCVGMAYETGVTDFAECMKKLSEMAKNQKVVGVGEAGLNYYAGMSESLREYQKRLFEMHLQLAAGLNVPIQIHNRGADEDILKAVAKYRPRAVLHCFTGGEEYMRKMNKLGCYFSFGGMITYKKNENLRKTASLVPAERLLLETDSPYLAPEPMRGSINEPANVKIIAETMSKIRGVGFQEISRLTADNAQNLFLAR